MTAPIKPQPVPKRAKRSFDRQLSAIWKEPLFETAPDATAVDRPAMKGPASVGTHIDPTTGLTVHGQPVFEKDRPNPLRQIVEGTGALGYAATHPELAIGQGKNRGVVLEFDADGIRHTRPITGKPGDPQGLERVMSDNSQQEYQQALRAFTIKAGVRPSVYTNRLKGIIPELLGQGWTREQVPGGVRYARPEKIPGA